MKEDPENFEDVSGNDYDFGHELTQIQYHVGFRRQVQSWPSNPVSYYISELSSYPTKTVIADLGCGDAALARALLAKNFIVLSFDLVSDGVHVIEADICSQVPLPGSEPQSAEPTQGEAQVVDVVVCALSLMSTNWPKCISEAWRILRPGCAAYHDLAKLRHLQNRQGSIDDCRGCEPFYECGRLHLVDRFHWFQASEEGDWCPYRRLSMGNMIHRMIATAILRGFSSKR